MNAVRSIVFNFFFFTGSLALSILLLWALLLPKNTCAKIVSEVYGGYVSFIEKYIMGITLEVKGLSNIPKDGAFILASKHQSAFETFKLPYMRKLGYPAVIFKKELSYIPIWGWYPARMGGVAIDRGAGAKAMRSLIKGCKASIENGRPIVIFPQGTRTKVGAKAPYKPGIAKIYKDLNVPVIPVALNSGLFWGKSAFLKKSGKVTFEILPAIKPGKPPLKMMEELETAIETASDRLAKKRVIK